MWSWDDVDKYRVEKLAQEDLEICKLIDTVQTIHSGGMAAYLTYMLLRLKEMKRVLKPTGSIYIHCDPTASHYLKLVMDTIFGKENFRNEVIWTYGLGGSSKRNFSEKHDIILFYSKSGKYYFNKPTMPSTSRKMAGKKKGMLDVWIDIPSLNNRAKERTGYPTQKPLKLLERIIEASSNPGDVVLDPFCGCATTCIAAERLGRKRKWIGIDISEKAGELVKTRLDNEGLYIDFNIHTKAPTRTDIETVNPRDKEVKLRLYGNQDGICNGCKSSFPIRNLEIDHILPKSVGGTDHEHNLQLLCGHCNRTKGTKPDDYFKTMMETRRLSLREVTY